MMRTTAANRVVVVIVVAITVVTVVVIVRVIVSFVVIAVKFPLHRLEIPSHMSLGTR